MQLTKEQITISNKNYQIAKKYFNLQKGWVLHHKDPTWYTNDIERYIQWNIDDLIPMTKGDHRRLHMQLTVDANDTKKYGRPLSQEQKDNLLYYAKMPKTEEHKQKLSESNKGKHNNKGINNPNYGKKHPGIGGRKKGSPKTKGNTGMHWFTNGLNNVQSYECPEGYYKGRTLNNANTEVS